MTQDNFQKRVLQRLDKLDIAIEKISKPTKKSNDLISNSQPAVKLMVNLSFALIVIMTVTAVIDIVLPIR